MPEPDLGRLVDSYALDTAQTAAVERAYRVFRRHHAPFLVAITAQMLPDLQRDTQAGHQVLFLGRDAYSLAISAHVLAPAWYDQHAHVPVLSRAVVEAALQDREHYLGEQFPQLETFRNRSKPSTIDGASRQLTRYLRSAGIPVGSRTPITVVDTSFKGTIQELLAAHYPATPFTGRYAFFAASPHDPHPGTKQGYAFHRGEPDTTWQWGLPVVELPTNRLDTFGVSEAIAVIEETMHGPWDSPTQLAGEGPRQTPQRHVPIEGINPVLIADEYRDPTVREAVKAAALLAVHHTATDTAAAGMADPRVPADMAQSREHFTTQTRAWISRDHTALDPDLHTVLDSFVRRLDRALVDQLAEALPDREQTAMPVWQQFAELDTLDAKNEFVQQWRARPTSTKSLREQAATTAARVAARPQAGASHGATPHSSPKRPGPQAPLPRYEPPQQGR